MSTSALNSTISRIQKEIAGLEKNIAQESEKEARALSRINQIERSISKNTSLSTLNSKMSEIQRKKVEIAKIQSKKADLSKKIATKSEEKNRNQQRLSREEETERRKLLSTEKKQQKRLRNEISHTEQYIKSQRTHSEETTVEYDIFISHASEDKDDFVRPLAEYLKSKSIKVWYDEFTLKVGDSLRKSIDKGLINSRFGTIVLSSSFFSKNWTQYELDAMVAKEMEGHKMILPIWHKVSKTEVLNFSPTLADKVALNSSLNSIEEIGEKLITVIKA